MGKDKEAGFPPITREHVVFAYRLFLDREPENEEAVAAKLVTMKNTEELREHFMASSEYRAKHPGLPALEDETGIPLPPRKLIERVTGAPDPAWYIRSGRRVARQIEALAAAHAFPLDGMKRILDLGCGCGRVLRHFKCLEGPVFFGTDIDAPLLHWCKNKLGFALVTRNEVAPPLPFETASFDMLYAVSVLTHLPAPLQQPWMNELSRILAPGGLLYLTLHGRAALSHLSTAQRRRFDKGELFVLHEEEAGGNGCAAFHPEAYVRQVLIDERAFEILEVLPDGAEGTPQQDAYLLRRRR